MSNPTQSIPAPPRSVCEMTAGCSDRYLRTVLHKVGREAFQELLDKGYVLNLFGPYIMDFKYASDEACGKYKILYAVIDEKTLQKIGLTGDLEFRKLFYDGSDNCHFVPFVKLRQLEKEMDSFLQRKYRELVAAIRTSDDAPEPVRKLFEMIDVRGGEEFGVKGNVIDRIVEVGAQLYYNLPAPGEVVLFRATDFEERKQRVDHAAAIIIPIVQSHLDMTKKIETHVVSSWNTSYYTPRDEDDQFEKFNSSHVTMEYVTGRVIQDLTVYDTLPVPAKPNATTADEAFSRDYNKTQVSQGIERLHNFLRGMKDNSYMVLDTNEVLFGSKTTDIVRILEQQYMYDFAIDVWDEECIILTHAKYKRVICLHSPVSFGSDSRSKIPLWLSNRRALLVEVLKIVTRSLISDDEKEDRDIYADAIFGSYVFEWFRTAAGMDKRVSAAAFRDAVTPKSDFPLRQGVSGRTIAEQDYPITKKLRRDYNHGTDHIDRPQKPLSIRRATNVLSYVEDANDSGQIAAAMGRAEKIILEDNPSYDSIRYRWKSALSGIDSNSPLRQAIEAVQTAAKGNNGNGGARGLSSDVMERYEEDFLRILSLPFSTPFYVRSEDVLPVPTSVSCTHPVFTTFTESGLRGRVQGGRTTQNNTQATQASRSPILLKLNRVLGSDGRTQYAGNGSLVLCQVLPRADNPTVLMEQQMQQIEATEIGVKIWVRLDRKSSSEDPPPGATTHPCYKMPVFFSVRDRLKKTKLTLGKSINKIMNGNRPVKSSCGVWVLAQIVSVKKVS